MNLQKNRGVNDGIRRGGVRTVTPSCEGHGGAVTNRARRDKKTRSKKQFCGVNPTDSSGPDPARSPTTKFDPNWWSWAQMASGLGPSKLPCTPRRWLCTHLSESQPVECLDRRMRLWKPPPIDSTRPTGAVSVPPLGGRAQNGPSTPSTSQKPETTTLNTCLVCRPAVSALTQGAPCSWTLGRRR